MNDQHSPQNTVSVLLVNGWSDDNKGDAAIVEGFSRSMSRAAEAEGHRLELSLISNFSGPNSEMGYHYRHTKNAYPGGVYASLLPVNLTVPSGGVATKALRRALQLLIATLLLALPRSRLIARLLSEPQRRTLERFHGAGVVASKGGHIFASNGSPLSLVGLFSNLYPLLLAQRLSIPTGIYGQSIGPVIGANHRKLLSRVLKRMRFVYLREPTSVEYVRALLPTAHHTRLKLVWDTAFSIESAPLPERVTAKLPERFVALTVRQWAFPFDVPGRRNALYEAYLSAIAHVVRQVVTELETDVVVVPQVIGPTGLENDLTAQDQLKAQLGEQNRVHYLHDDFTAGQLMNLYGRATLLIGTRFHSVILALAAGTPAVAIAYHGFKTRGIMQMLGLEQYVLDIGALDREDLWQRVLAAYGEREAYAGYLSKRIPPIAKDEAETARQVVDLLGSERLSP